MGACEFVNFISCLACKIAEGKSEEEIGILSALFTQLRRYVSYNISV